MLPVLLLLTSLVTPGYHVPSTNPRSNVVASDRCGWENVEAAMAPRVMERYFGVPVDVSQECDVFLVEGVPAASMLYKKKGMKLVVDEFHLNEGMLLLFDAGNAMRRELYRRYKQGVVTRHAVNRDRFMQIP